MKSQPYLSKKNPVFNKVFLFIVLVVDACLIGGCVLIWQWLM